MLRSLLLVSVLFATIAACSPAEPPLLIDGAQAPATVIAHEPPPAVPPAASENAAISR